MTLPEFTIEKKRIEDLEKYFLSIYNNKKCFECGVIKELKDFDKTDKELLKSDKGHCRVCKECISKRQGSLMPNGCVNTVPVLK